jgi:hypothetical protein
MYVGDVWTIGWIIWSTNFDSASVGASMPDDIKWSGMGLLGAVDVCILGPP